VVPLEPDVAEDPLVPEEPEVPDEPSPPVAPCKFTDHAPYVPPPTVNVGALNCNKPLTGE
jgi:hypothetical protein